MKVDNENNTEKNTGMDTDKNTPKNSKDDGKDEQLRDGIVNNDSNATLELEEKYKDLERKFAYLYADFENYKRRAKDDNSKFLFFGLKKFILDILPVLDDLERAVSFTDSATKEWLVPIVSKFTHVLSDNSIKKITTNKGDVYDEKIHNAAATSQTSNDEKSSDKSLIKDVIRNGYTLNGKVIRYVDVVV